MQRMAMRALFIPVYGLAGLGTAAAYLHFVTGAIAGFEGIVQGRYLLGPLLLLLCVLGAFALWRVWAIGGRIWRYGAYMNASSQDYRYDRAGVAAAGAAFVGFVAISGAIYRGEEVVIFGILLMPASCLASLTFLWIKSDPAPAPVEAGDAIPSATALKLWDLPGLVCGTALGLYGAYRFVPVPISGWGSCDWTIFYPLQSISWPYRRPEVFDACDDSTLSLTLITSVLVIVCLVAGAVAAFIGRTANARRGTWAAGIVVAVVLARLAIQMSEVATAWHIAWTESVITGLLIVLGAAWVGHVGGSAGVELRRRLSGASRMLAARSA